MSVHPRPIGRRREVQKSGRCSRRRQVAIFISLGCLSLQIDRSPLFQVFSRPTRAVIPSCVPEALKGSGTIQRRGSTSPRATQNPQRSSGEVQSPPISSTIFKSPSPSSSASSSRPVKEAILKSSKFFKVHKDRQSTSPTRAHAEGPLPLVHNIFLPFRAFISSFVPEALKGLGTIQRRGSTSPRATQSPQGFSGVVQSPHISSTIFKSSSPSSSASSSRPVKEAILKSSKFFKVHKDRQSTSPTRAHAEGPLPLVHNIFLPFRAFISSFVPEALKGLGTIQRRGSTSPRATQSPQGFSGVVQSPRISH